MKRRVSGSLHDSFAKIHEKEIYMQQRFILCTVCLIAMFVWATPGFGQDRIKLSGLAYVDYYYIVSAPESALEGQNGFTYRRLYLTTDYRISDAFSGRARLEVNESVTVSRTPVAFVKDLYLRWTTPNDHAFTFGISSTPGYEAAEEVWGFRSLEKTLMDLYGVVSSRDFGVRADGPVLADGSVRYAVMFGNNNSIRPEDDKYKRGYGLLSVRPVEHVVLGIGSDYAGYGDERSRGVTISGFAGYIEDAFRFGAEGFWNQIQYRNDDENTVSGVSVFGSGYFNARWGLVGRLDRVRLENAPLRADKQTLGILGVIFRPDKQIWVIPNLHILKRDGADQAQVMSRVTLDFRF